VIAYDRRGFGNSSHPTVGFDYDTFAADLNALIEHLDLNDIVLAGFSMGTGEVTRYLGTYGSSRVRKAALLGAIPPFLLKTDDNPEGVDGSVFDGIRAAVVADRPAYFKAFFDDFYNVDVLGGERISATLLVHGDADRILPFEATAKRLPALIADLKFVVVEGGPHNIAWTHPEEVNGALKDFLDF
jgi:non-heme chloroperoxidase